MAENARLKTEIEMLKAAQSPADSNPAIANADKRTFKATTKGAVRKERLKRFNSYEEEKKRQESLTGEASPVCPNCGSTNARKKGYGPARADGTKARRYQCQDCEKNFLGDYERGPLDMPKRSGEGVAVPQDNPPLSPVG